MHAKGRRSVTTMQQINPVLQATNTTASIWCKNILGCLSFQLATFQCLQGDCDFNSTTSTKWQWLFLSRRGPMFVLFLVCMFYSGNTNQEHQRVKLMAGTPEQRSCTIMKYFPLEILGNMKGFFQPHAWMFVSFNQFLRSGKLQEICISIFS